MSGLSKLQRAVMTVLADGEPRFTWQIVVDAYGLRGAAARGADRRQSAAMEKTVRRVLVGLVKAGQVRDLGRGWRAERGTASKMWAIRESG